MNESGAEKQPNQVWQDQEEEVIQITLEEVGTRAQKLQQESVREFWTWMLSLGFLITVFSVYLVHFVQPLLRLSCLSGISVLLYLGLRINRNRKPPRIHAAARPQVCVDFLRAELGRKREEVLEIRWVLCLLFPGALGFWWGGGPVGVLKWLGIDWPSVLWFYVSPGLLIMFTVLLALTWIGCGREAQSLEREIQAISKLAHHETHCC